MTADQLAQLSGVILSLVLGYAPGLKTWYDNLDNPNKVALTGGLLVVTAAGALAWGCRADPAGLTACMAAGWEPAVSVLISALIANQAGYVLLVKPFNAPAA